MNMATVHCSCCSVCSAPSSLCPRASGTATVCCHVSACFLGGGSCLLVFLLRVFLQVSSTQFIQCGQYRAVVTVSTCSTPPPKSMLSPHLCSCQSVCTCSCMALGKDCHSRTPARTALHRPPMDRLPRPIAPVSSRCSALAVSRCLPRKPQSKC